LRRSDGEREDGREGLLRDLAKRDQVCQVALRDSPRSAT
jgi:hypothetical protein